MTEHIKKNIRKGAFLHEILKNLSEALKPDEHNNKKSEQLHNLFELDTAAVFLQHILFLFSTSSIVIFNAAESCRSLIVSVKEN